MQSEVWEMGEPIRGEAEDGPHLEDRRLHWPVCPSQTHSIHIVIKSIRANQKLDWASGWNFQKILQQFDNEEKYFCKNFSISRN